MGLQRHVYAHSIKKIIYRLYNFDRFSYGFTLDFVCLSAPGWTVKMMSRERRGKLHTLRFVVLICHGLCVDTTEIYLTETVHHGIQ